MFENIGGKLKKFAIIVFAVVTVLVSFLGLRTLAMSYVSPILFIGAILIIGIGILAAYISSMFIYAFGELVENTASIKEASQNTSEDIKTISRKLKEINKKDEE